MKYLIIVPDGSADNIHEGEKTPLEEAHMPFINSLAAFGEVGTVKTIPDGIAPGSDAANLAVMGYDPVKYLTGRSPLEAVSMGIDMADDDVAFRANLVTLEEDTPGCIFDYLLITDHSSGDITNEEAEELIRFLDERLGSGLAAHAGRVKLYPGVSYRNALIVSKGPATASFIGDISLIADTFELTPPHDILGKRIGAFLPRGEGSEFLTALTWHSYKLLLDHPINVSRRERGLRPASALWLWGQGKKPALDSFKGKYGIEGSVISAVDLIKGIGICAGLDAIDVEGANGLIDTNYAGKAAAAITEYQKGKDFVYIHIEAPDECSHQGQRAEKIRSLEFIDKEIAGPIVSFLETAGEDFRVLVVPDHRTPLELRTHTADSVPYVLYDSRRPAEEDRTRAFSERAAMSGRSFETGAELASYFFGVRE